MKNKWLIAGILIVALLVLCAGMVLILRFSADTLRSDSDLSIRFFQNDSIKAEADEVKTLQAGGPLELVVNNHGGEVSVEKGTDGQVKISMHKTAWANSEKNAREELKSMDIRIRQEGSRITVEYILPETLMVAGRVRTDTVDFTITVPAETSVRAGSAFGDVSLSGTRGRADLECDFGNVSVTDVSGEVSVRSSSGNLEAEGIQAGQGGISLSSDYGRISLSNAAAGEVSLDSSSGTISLEEVRVAGKVEASTDYGDLQVKDVQAQEYVLKTSSGSIRVDGVSGVLKADSGYGPLEITNAEQVSLDISTNSGKIEFSGSLGKGPHKVNSDYGSIVLFLPENSRLTVDLKTDYGRVQSEIPVTIQGEVGKESMTGTLNGGGGSLTVTTNSGDIRIKILK